MAFAAPRRTSPLDATPAQPFTRLPAPAAAAGLPRSRREPWSHPFSGRRFPCELRRARPALRARADSIASRSIGLFASLAWPGAGRSAAGPGANHRRVLLTPSRRPISLRSSTSSRPTPPRHHASTEPSVPVSPGLARVGGRLEPCHFPCASKPPPLTPRLPALTPTSYPPRRALLLGKRPAAAVSDRAHLPVTAPAAACVQPPGARNGGLTRLGLPAPFPDPAESRCLPARPPSISGILSPTLGGATCGRGEGVANQVQLSCVPAAAAEYAMLAPILVLRFRGRSAAAYAPASIASPLPACVSRETSERWSPS